jgi:tetratricopeptide (TPR) repeat protein
MNPISHLQKNNVIYSRVNCVSNIFKILLIIIIFGCSPISSKETKEKKINSNVKEILITSESLIERYGLIEESIRLLKETRSLYPSHLHGFEFNLAIIYAKIKKEDKVYIHLKKTIQANSTFAHPFYWLGKIYLEKQLLDFSIKHYQSAIKIYNKKLLGVYNKTCDCMLMDPNDIDGYPNQMRYKRAMSYAQLGFVGYLMQDRKMAFSYTLKSRDYFVELSNVPDKPHSISVKRELRIVKESLEKMIKEYKLNSLNEAIKLYSYPVID